jgi:YVTN family beta-propeller protein
MNADRAPVIAVGLVLACCAVATAAAQEHPGEAESERAPFFLTTHGGPRLDIVARARTGVLPKSVTISPDGTRVVVCNFGRLDLDGVFVYDAMTLALLGVVSFPGNAVESLFSADGSTLYVSNFRRGVIEVIDVASLSLRAEITVGAHPKFMAISPDGGTLYVANWGERTVSVVDLATGTQLRRLRTERHPRGLVVRPDGTLLAASFHGNVVHVFPPGATREAERWEMCDMPRHLVLSPDGATLYVSCSMGHVGFYDALTGRRRGIAPTGRNPRSIAIDGGGRFIGVANYTSHDVSLIDTVERRHRTYEIERGTRIVGVAMHPGPAVRIYATSWDAGELIVLAERERGPVGHETDASDELDAPPGLAPAVEHGEIAAAPAASP